MKLRLAPLTAVVVTVLPVVAAMGGAWKWGG
jgi:hypothetical protein